MNSTINKINESRKYLLIYFLLKNFADLFLKICAELYFLKNLCKFFPLAFGVRVTDLCRIDWNW